MFEDYGSLQFAGAWFAMLGYTCQLYFDFCGYSNMAVGLGRLLGFEFPQNFDSPYQSENISEFWRRWHITLSSWLRDYLFIPLGGSRDGHWLTLRNLVIVMFLGGLWHGAGWTFVLWGPFPRHVARLLQPVSRGCEFLSKPRSNPKSTFNRHYILFCDLRMDSISFDGFGDVRFVAQQPVWTKRL